jgi:hypothetical protein
MKSFITVGKLTLSIQAFITALVGIVIGTMVILRGGVFLGVLTTGLFFVTAYSVNCMVVGKCVVWAWVLAIVYTLYAVLAVLSGGAYFATRQLKSKI